MTERANDDTTEVPEDVRWFETLRCSVKSLTKAYVVAVSRPSAVSVFKGIFSLIESDVTDTLC